MFSKLRHTTVVGYLTNYSCYCYTTLEPNYCVYDLTSEPKYVCNQTRNLED